MIIVKSISAGNILLLSFLVLLKSRHDNRKANYWLAFFLFIVAMILLDECFTDEKLYLDYPHLFNLLDVFIFALAPSLYQSVLFFVEPGKKMHARDLYHFIPFFIYFILNLPGLFDTAAEKKQAFLSTFQVLGETDLVSDLLLLFLFLQCFMYVSASLVRLYLHRRNLMQYSSSIKGLELNWMIYLTLGIFFMLLTWILEYLLFRSHIYLAAHWGYLFASYYIGYVALGQKEVFPYPTGELTEIRTLIDRKIVLDKTDNGKQEQHLLSAKEQLNSFMLSEKPYLDNELSLPKLAKLNGMSTHELSNLINQGFEQNFYQFVNNFRIEESKRLLRDPSYAHLNMLGIAYEAGFNSKTTFNTTFKKSVGMSPSAFRSAEASVL